MLNVLDSTKQLYMQSSPKQVVISVPNKGITLTNTNLVSESVELKEMIESQNFLEFKGCNSSQFKFNVAGLLTDIRDEYVEASIQAGTSEVISLFKGYVVTQNNRNNEDVVTEIRSQDVLYKIRDLDVTSWYTGLTSSITMADFRNSFFTYLGTLGYSLDQVIDGTDLSLINDALTLNKLAADKLPKVINAYQIYQGI